MTPIKLTIGSYVFSAHLEDEKAPKTVSAIKRYLPFSSSVIHVRWSGEGVWGPLGDRDFEVEYENHTSYPAPGQMILYPGGISETEILLAYGGVHFASKMGQITSNHFLTVISPIDQIEEMGKKVLWEGQLPLEIALK